MKRQLFYSGVLFAFSLCLNLFATENLTFNHSPIFLEYPTVINDKKFTDLASQEQIDGLIEDFLQEKISIDNVEGQGLWLSMSGGDIIGNGGGIGESYYQYALLELPTFISECLNSSFCHLDEEERRVLRLISHAAKLNSELDYALLFVDPEVRHTLFLQEDGMVRSALTGRKPMLPIFINLDHVYSKTELSIQLLDAVRILVHELGHQVGVENHSYLDRLGAKVHQFINIQSVEKNSIIDGNNNLYELWIKNPDTYEMTSFSVFFAKNGDQVDLRDRFLDLLKCPEGLTVFDYKFQNIHWLKSESNQIDKVGAWAKVQCMELDTGLSNEIILDDLVISLD